MKTGDKVVCIDDCNLYDPTKIVKQPVIKGEIYTVRGFSESPMGNVGILLEELHNDTWRNGVEGSFNPKRFRPINYQFGEDVCEAVEKSLAPKEYEPVL